MVASYVSLDLETTGLNPKLDRIIEIGALKVVSGEVIETFSTYVYPGRTLPSRIVELTGITDHDLEDARTISEILPELIDFIGDFPLLGHSILFDYSFLKKACQDSKIPFEKEGIDTLQLARIYLTNLDSRRLEHLCKHYAIPILAHRALEDARASHFLYQKLVEEFYQEETFRTKGLFCKIKRDTPITPKQIQFLEDLIKRHNLQPEYQVKELFKSEASREIDKILATFGR